MNKTATKLAADLSGACLYEHGVNSKFTYFYIGHEH